MHLKKSNFKVWVMEKCKTERKESIIIGIREFQQNSKFLHSIYF